MPKFLFPSAFVLLLISAGCITPIPATDTGDPSTTPLGPSGTPTSPVAAQDSVAYDPDMKALFSSDCVVCHGSARADANYRVTTYAQTMALVRPGNASSRLVTATQQNGSMYRYFSGGSATRQAKAALVRSWVVTYNAQETR